MALLNEARARLVIRSFAVVCLIMAALGLLLCSEAAIHFRIPHAPSAGQPYLAQAFWIMTAVNYAFSVILGVGSILLLKVDRRGLRLCNTLFVSEIIYWIGGLAGSLYLYLALRNQGAVADIWRSVAGAMGIGNMGIAPQVITGYPVIALVLLNLAFRKIPGASPVRSSAST